jgi:hypothetical protein
VATDNKNAEKERYEARAQAQSEAKARNEESAKPSADEFEAAGLATNDAGAPTTSLDPIVGLANSSLASTGEQVEVPKTPKEIAKEGSELGAAGDFSTGGNLPPQAGSGAPVFARVWSMDADHTTGNRHLPDTFKPDCSVRVS